MTSPESLYQLFNLQSDCSDGELRQAYHQLMLANHPDLNPENIDDATKKAQQINDAYSQLKDYRQNLDGFLFGVSGINIEFHIQLGQKSHTR